MDIQEAVAKRLNITEVKQGYGLTETTLAVLRTPNDKIKPGSVGVVVPGISGIVIFVIITKAYSVCFI